ncbi:MAG: cob(I)yrinic acid a,c-diamide adenosyltransferase [Candidatus Loosdrechtia sp.]|uniref:cob(I)yrinic acid a,c-diamide adenosyltransferase n=1 Tax=Candidatus Loosdrechtia sp. TaxID=3101272 RepID=UPI003A75B76E|nr:MAG: cob(I)yrinic acid a,c-diamide adenosyltransferase [Candidatus Jettenia sp. AMX2]
MESGLIIVNTGEGKGKTTAALGLGLRAVGHGMKVLMLQFIKGSWHTGELDAVKRLEPDFRIVQLGQGFIRKVRKGSSGNYSGTHPDTGNAQIAWDYAKQEIFTDLYDIIILDEINNLIDYGLLDVDVVITALQERPARLHVILTGRNAHYKIIEIADIVTDMHETKHCYKDGIKAQRGIEF